MLTGINMGLSFNVIILLKHYMITAQNKVSRMQHSEPHLDRILTPRDILFQNAKILKQMFLTKKDVKDCKMDLITFHRHA